MRNSLTQRLKARMASCVAGWATLGRLYGLKVLSASALSDMEASAHQFARSLDRALRLEHFCSDYYMGKRPAVGWPSRYNPERVGILSSGVICHEELEASIADLEFEIRDVVSDILSTLDTSILTKPVTCLLIELASELPPSCGGDGKGLLCVGDEKSYKSQTPMKVVSGPISVPCDPVFRPAYSLLEFDAPTFGDNPRQTVPYFWTLANREALASQLCSLSAIEYDGLPLEFYWDMAKQSWDEARHANYFLEMSIKLIPKLAESTTFDFEVPWGVIDEFLATGRGLPIPREGNLYESMLNADLIERLILMNYRTETPAVARKTLRMNSDFCRLYPEVADGYEIDKLDETSHSIIGKRWLEFLLPDAQERSVRIEETDLLRNVLLLTSFCHHGSMSLTRLLMKYANATDKEYQDSTRLNS